MKQTVYLFMIVLLLLVGCSNNTSTTNSTNNTNDSSTNKETATNVGTDNSKDENIELKELQTKLDDIFTEQFELHQFNGMVLIAKDGDIILNIGNAI